MDLTALAGELQTGLKLQVLTNEPLSRHTTWRLGGPADLLARPRSREELDYCLSFARRKGLPLHILGNGSNLLVLDGGVRGLVVQTREWRQVIIEGRKILATAGTLLPGLLQVASKKGLGGLEFAAGIPATVGGAVVMNAGTPAGCLGDRVVGVEVLDYDGRRHILENGEITFTYRHSSLHRAGTVVTVTLELVPDEVPAIRERIEANLHRRRSRQPLEWPNAGSVFKNPPGYYAGRLIEAVGAKGWRVGGAEVAEKHANFIINRGQATAADVMELIDRVREAVARQLGIDLELEIEVWGEGL
ncbi:UDP-N-acetylmuramate dehydrogenase [Neomoorella thermoacetica]|uniref:UDP-N-acetylmuramate dehydrogenase n=1 Tax=Neomoorella thermoacetica TaxID=1525 RepID=UPI0008FB21D9|nr:UDP-N-acetylmuramate dehydrogenase [Moorella thermoacetica]APC07966.1 UDP-N-acetylenolpyruvoylglucosamine reductase [Moorella thermoacetica]